MLVGSTSVVVLVGSSSVVVSVVGGAVVEVVDEVVVDDVVVGVGPVVVVGVGPVVVGGGAGGRVVDGADVVVEASPTDVTVGPTAPAKNGSHQPLTLTGVVAPGEDAAPPASSQVLAR